MKLGDFQERGPRAKRIKSIRASASFFFLFSLFHFNSPSSPAPAPGSNFSQQKITNNKDQKNKVAHVPCSRKKQQRGLYARTNETR